MNIDIGRSITYPFEDKQWTIKVGILLVLGFIPGLNIIIWSGYALTIARNVLRGVASPLPAWDNWSDIAVRGLLSIVATFIYYLPALIVTCCLSVGFPLASGRSSGGLYTTVQCCSAVFALVYSLAVYLLLNVGHVRYAETDQFNSYLEFGARFRDLQSNFNLFTTLLVIEVILNLIAAALAALLAITCIGGIAVITLAFLANGFILGQAAVAFAGRKRQA